MISVDVFCLVFACYAVCEILHQKGPIRNDTLECRATKFLHLRKLYDHQLYLPAEDLRQSNRMVDYLQSIRF